MSAKTHKCYEVLTKLHTICFLNISNFKFIHENLIDRGGGVEKKCVFIIC